MEVRIFINFFLGQSTTEQFYDGINDEDVAEFNKAWKQTAKDINYQTQFGKPLKVMELGKARTVIAGADSVYGAPSLVSRNPNFSLKLVPEGYKSPVKDVAKKSVSTPQLSASPVIVEKNPTPQLSQVGAFSVHQSQKTGTYFSPSKSIDHHIR